MAQCGGARDQIDVNSRADRCGAEVAHQQSGLHQTVPAARRASLPEELHPVRSDTTALVQPRGHRRLCVATRAADPTTVP